MSACDSTRPWIHASPKSAATRSSDAAPNSRRSCDPIRPAGLTRQVTFRPRASPYAAVAPGCSRIWARRRMAATSAAAGDDREPPCWRCHRRPSRTASLTPATPAMRSRRDEPANNRTPSLTTCRVHVAGQPPVVTSTRSRNTPRRILAPTSRPRIAVSASSSAGRGLGASSTSVHSRPSSGSRRIRRGARSAGRARAHRRSPPAAGRAPGVGAPRRTRPSPFVQRPRAPRWAAGSDAPSSQTHVAGPAGVETTGLEGSRARREGRTRTPPGTATRSRQPVPARRDRQQPFAGSGVHHAGGSGPPCRPGPRAGCRGQLAPHGGSAQRPEAKAMAMLPPYIVPIRTTSNASRCKTLPTTPARSG